MANRVRGIDVSLGRILRRSEHLRRQMIDTPRMSPLTPATTRTAPPPGSSTPVSGDPAPAETGSDAQPSAVTPSADVQPGAAEVAPSDVAAATALVQGQEDCGMARTREQQRRRALEEEADKAGMKSFSAASGMLLRDPATLRKGTAGGGSARPGPVSTTVPRGRVGRGELGPAGARGQLGPAGARRPVIDPRAAAFQANFSSIS